MNKMLAVVILLICNQGMSVYAQRSARFTEPNFLLKRAVVEIEQDHYQQAALDLDHYLQQYHQNAMDNHSMDQARAMYYRLLCRLRLNEPKACELLDTFLSRTPFYMLQQLGSFELAKYYYQHNQFDEAIKKYEAVQIGSLSNQELIQRNFELGYSYLVTQQLDKVEPYFQSAKNIPGDYFKPGNYYHGLMAYYKKNYAEARASFKAVEQDERYKNIVPFYLTEIDYMTGEKEKALAEALNYLNASSKLYYDHELNEMVAQIYFEKSDFEKAATYYETFIAQSKFVSDENYFKLAYCLYQQGKLEEAINHLEKIQIQENELSKHSCYLLANCYLKLNEKQKALQFFDQYLMSANEAATKDLIAFTIVKLSYEIENEELAISTLKAFLSSYQFSSHIDQANEMLALLYIKQNQFKAASEVMDRMKNKSSSLEKLYQKTNYAQGIERLQNDHPETAKLFFLETKKYPVDKSIVSLSDFWLAECHYRMNQDSDAMNDCNHFLQYADTVSMPDYTKNIHLTRSYLYFHQHDSVNLPNEYLWASGDSSLQEMNTRLAIDKPKFVPEKIPAVPITTLVMQYDVPDEPVHFVYKPIALKPLAMAHERDQHTETNYVYAGVGNLSSLDLGLGMHLDKWLSVPAFINLNVSSSKGKIKNQDINTAHLGFHSITQAYKHTIDWSFNVDRNRVQDYGYDHQLYDYPKNAIKQVYVGIGAEAHITPSKKNTAGIQYQADVYTGLYLDRNHSGAGEYTLKLDAPISKQLKSDVWIASDVLADANFYFVGDRSTQINSILSWRPSINKQINRLHIKAGLYPTVGQYFSLLPDLSIQYPILKSKIEWELACQSQIHLNTYKQMTTLNPFLFDSYGVKQSRNTDFVTGFKGSLHAGLSYSLRTGFSILENLPVLINDTAFDNKQFKVLYDDKASAFLFAGAIDYTLNSNFNLGGHVDLHPILHLSTLNEAWHYVPSVMDVYGKINWIHGLTIKADLFLLAGSKAIRRVSEGGSKTLASGVDLNASVQYTMAKQWHINLSGNNLFGSNYQRWNGYPMFGTQVLLGLSYSFKNFEVKK